MTRGSWRKRSPSSAPRSGSIPTPPRPHTNLGMALHETGRVDEAMAEFREAIRIDPDFAIGHYNLGVALKEQGKLDEAIVEYRAAIRIDPDDAYAHENLDIALEEQARRNEAIDEDPLRDEDAVPGFGIRGHRRDPLEVPRLREETGAAAG